MRNVGIIIIALAAVTVAPRLAAADEPGAHPAYLHALSDMREARALLERPAKASVKWDEKVAIKELDAAIHEIKEAAIDDGKPLDEHPPVDSSMEYGGRLHKADELIMRARADINEREDDKWSRGLKHRAIKHLDVADGYVKQGIASAEEPAKHPAYLKALTDLRAARAHLEKPGNSQVRWDEKAARREIEAAIHEIKEAAVEDGKDIEDHPPIDAGLDWGGRLHHAVELLQGARADVAQREDDNFARGLKHRALQHIDAAIKLTQQGIAAQH